jgi:hypothetical protein
VSRVADAAVTAQPIDLLPADAPLALAVRSIDAVDADAAELLQAAELTTLSTFKQVLTVIGVRQALDTTRGVAAAVVLLPAESTGDAQHDTHTDPETISTTTPRPRRVGVILLLPTTSHAAFTDAMRAEPLAQANDDERRTDDPSSTAEGSPRASIARFTFDDATVFTSPAAPGYSAAALRPETLAAWTFSPGNHAARLARLTEPMQGAAATSDITLFVDPPAAARLLRDVAAGAFQTPGLSGPRVIAAAEQAADAERGFPPSTLRIFDALIPVADQTAAAVWTFDPGPRGLTVRALGVAKPLSPFAATTALLNAPPASSISANATDRRPDFSDDPLAGMPTVGWLGAFAVDAHGREPGLRTIAASLLGVGLASVMPEAEFRERLIAAAQRFNDAALVVYNHGAAARLRHDPTPEPSGDTDDPPPPSTFPIPFDEIHAAPPSILNDMLAELVPNARDDDDVANWRLTARRADLFVASSGPLADRLADATDAADEMTLRRSGIAAERMVRAVRRVLPDDPIAEVHINMQAVIERAQPWLDERELDLLNPRRYPPLAAAVDVRRGVIELTAFVPAATVQNAFEMRRVLPRLLDAIDEADTPDLAPTTRGPSDRLDQPPAPAPNPSDQP